MNEDTDESVITKRIDNIILNKNDLNALNHLNPNLPKLPFKCYTDNNDDNDFIDYPGIPNWDNIQYNNNHNNNKCKVTTPTNFYLNRPLINSDYMSGQKSTNASNESDEEKNNPRSFISNASTTGGLNPNISNNSNNNNNNNNFIPHQKIMSKDK